MWLGDVGERFRPRGGGVKGFENEELSRTPLEGEDSGCLLAPPFLCAFIGSSKRIGETFERERMRSVPAPNVGRTPVLPLRSVTNHTQPDDAIPRAAAEKLDLSCSRLPCSLRIVPLK